MKQKKLNVEEPHLVDLGVSQGDTQCTKNKDNFKVFR